MEPGSIDETVARLNLWFRQGHRGLARVEWDSNFAKQSVVSKLRLERQVIEISVPVESSPYENVRALIERLSELEPGEVVSITGLEGGITDPHNRTLDTLAALSFRREQLAALPIKQIWWIPASFSPKVILGVPDLDSWFQLRLHLTEIPRAPSRGLESLKSDPGASFDANEARALATRFWANIAGAREHEAPIQDIWGLLAKPAYSALMSVGMPEEARGILDEFSKFANLPKNETRVAEAGHEATLARAVNEYARTLTTIGDYAGARRWQERLLASMRRALGDEDPRTLIEMSNLASTLLDEGDLAGARDLMERVLAISQREYGDKHPNTLTAMNNLASAVRAQGDLAAAQVLQERVLAASRKMFGDEHPSTLAAMNNLAITLNERRDLSAARALLEEALAFSVRVLGERDPNTMKTKNNLAQTLRDQGDFTSARTLQEEVLESVRRELGEDHPDTLVAMNNLALTLYSQGDLAGARALQEQVLEAMRRKWGNNHVNTLRAMHNLASTLHDQENFEAARALQEHVVNTIRPLLGAEHPSTLTATSNLARTLRSQGDLAEAQRLDGQVAAALSLQSP